MLVQLKDRTQAKPVARAIERSLFAKGVDADSVQTLLDTQDRANKAFFSTGHNEYWTKEMFDAAENARDSGVNLAFFGADAVYTQVRFEPSAAGDPGGGRRRGRVPPVPRPKARAAVERARPAAERRRIRNARSRRRGTKPCRSSLRRAGRERRCRGRRS